MSNVHDVRPKKGVPVTIDGEEMTLRYTLNSFAEMEDRYGSIDAALEQMEKGSVRGVIFMLWCGFISEYPDVTEKEIGGKVELSDLQTLADAMGKALEADLPPQNANSKKKAQGPK